MPIYVNSGAGGANDGTSWTNAYTSFGNAGVTGAAAGSEIYVHNAHSQDPGANVTYNFSSGTEANPVRILCVDKDASDALDTGATIAQTVGGRTITINGSIYMHGMTFNSAGSLTLGTSSKSAFFTTCTFGLVVSASSLVVDIGAAGSLCDFTGCTFNPTNAAGSRTRTSGTGRAEFRNCVLNTHGSATTCLDVNGSGTINLRCCELQGATNQLLA